MATVAVMGMGLLGSGFAENLLAKGHTVRVWNRSPSKCAPLVALGAEAFETAAEAASGADRVHLVLSEDTAVEAVLADIFSGFGVSGPIVDHSTNLPAKVAERAARLGDEGVRYLHAPVFMAPAMAKIGGGLMLIAGPTAEVEALRPALEQMTGKLAHVGEAPERAAALKLVGNGLLVSLTAAIGDLYRVGAGAGLSPEDVIGLFELSPRDAAAIGRRILKSGEGPASFELSMALKDVRLMREMAGEAALTVLPAVEAAMEAAVEAGHGRGDYASFAR
jgi:3-hydroxyisobutyrate dehydrogenase-like beta-hydroxyacid dehydrogenase